MAVLGRSLVLVALFAVLVDPAGGAALGRAILGAGGWWGATIGARGCGGTG